MKRIFISQSVLNSGRNRQHRILEAKLDGQGKNESNSLSKVLSGGTKQNGKGYIFQREVPRNADTHPANTLWDNSYTLLNPKEILLFCNYLEFCNKVCFQGTDKYNNCQIRKFKDKYKDFDYGRQLGI